MLVLLPPSETKRDGGTEGSALDLAALSFPALASARRSAIAGLRSVSKSVATATAALKLGPTQAFEIERNRALGASPTMPAIERYTGVLYDGLAAETLPPGPRAALGDSAVIHSALFGLVRADDPIPAYRFSHDSRVPGKPLRALWAAAITRELVVSDELILDLRSEAYVELGPAPEREGSYFLRVVTDGPNGTKRALNHFNKKGKGEFVRALALAERRFETLDELLLWARASDIRLEPGAPGELELTV